MHKLKIYLAGPITGLSGSNVLNSLEEKTAILSDFGYVIYSPMLGKEHLRKVEELGPTEHQLDHHPIVTNHAIYNRDRWMVEQSDVVLVDLSRAERVSIGTMMEMAWASMLHKHIVLVMTPDNIHNHAFVLEAANIIFETMDDAYDYLKELSLSRSYQYE